MNIYSIRGTVRTSCGTNPLKKAKEGDRIRQGSLISVARGSSCELFISGGRLVARLNSGSTPKIMPIPQNISVVSAMPNQLTGGRREAYLLGAKRPGPYVFVRFET